MAKPASSQLQAYLDKVLGDFYSKEREGKGAWTLHQAAIEATDERSEQFIAQLFDELKQLQSSDNIPKALFDDAKLAGKLSMLAHEYLEFRHPELRDIEERRVDKFGLPITGWKL